MIIIAVATLVVLILVYKIYKWGWREAMAKEKERTAHWTIMHQLIHKAEYGAQLIAMHESDSGKKKRAERYYNKIHFWHDSLLDLPVTMARLSEFARAWDEGTDEQRKHVDDWQSFLAESS